MCGMGICVFMHVLDVTDVVGTYSKMIQCLCAFVQKKKNICRMQVNIPLFLYLPQ